MFVKCVVAGHGAEGPDLFFVIVDCSEVQYEDGYHYLRAEEWAKDDLDVDGPCVVFDEHDPPKPLFDLFKWETASIIL